MKALTVVRRHSAARHAAVAALLCTLMLAMSLMTVDPLQRAPVQVHPASQTYTVAAGDNLKRIAHRLDRTLPELVVLNSDRYPSLLTHPYVVRAGWTLRINPTPTSPSTTVGATYVVKRGDDVAAIAQRFGITRRHLVALNVGRYPSLASNPRVAPGWVVAVG